MSLPLRCPAGFFAESGAVGCTSCQVNDADVLQCTNAAVMLPSLYVNVIMGLGIGIYLMNFVYLFRFVRRRIANGWKISIILWLLLALLLGPLVWTFWMFCIWCYPEQYRDPIQVHPIDTSPFLPKIQHPKGSKLQIFRKDITISCEVKASGGFGTVYQGRYRGALVAVKEISDIGHLSDMDIRNFQREADVMRQVSSPHCVKLIGTCEPPDKLALVIEWMDGGNLHQALGRSQAAQDLPMHKRISVLRQVCTALAHLHESNPPIVHGDIKSMNVMLGDRICNKDVKLADFGLSCIRDISTRSRSSQIGTGPQTPKAGGTFCYMSPEMLLHSKFSSTQSDMWAFGMLMFETITGTKPWAGLTWEQVAVQLRENKKPKYDFTKVPDGISEDVYHLLLSVMFKCVEENPRARATAAEVATKLAALDENNPAKQTKLQLFQPGFESTFQTLSQCLQEVFPQPKDTDQCCQDVQMHLRKQSIANFVAMHKLSTLEASCIIAYSWNPAAPNQCCPYRVFNEACRFRETQNLEKWKHFTFHFLNGLRLPIHDAITSYITYVFLCRKLPNERATLFRGLSVSVTCGNSLYQQGRDINWSYVRTLRNSFLSIIEF
jgi:serine/threonine protein kinase